MKRSTVAIVALSAVLLGTNLWWAYHFVDQSVSYGYLSDERDRLSSTVDQALAVLPVAAGAGATRDGVIAAARAASKFDSDPFEKEGFVWVGHIGLRFDKEGRVVEVSTN